MAGDAEGVVTERTSQESLGQRLTGQVLHDDEGGAIGKAVELVDLDDTGVIDGVGRFGFVEESRRKLWILSVLRVQDFDGGSPANL